MTPQDAESPFCSRGFFLQKPSGNELCLVTDYRGINGLIERLEWLFQTTTTILSLIKGKLSWVCSVDMLSGYHQVPLAKKSRDLTTFLTPYSRYRFKYQSMGMKQARDVFCQATDKSSTPPGKSWRRPWETGLASSKVLTTS